MVARVSNQELVSTWHALGNARESNKTVNVGYNSHQVTTEVQLKATIAHKNEVCI